VQRRVREDRLVNRHRQPRRHRAQEVHRLAGLEPRRAGGQAEHVDLLLRHVERVAGVVEGAVVEQVADVRDDRNVLVDHGVLATDHVHRRAADLERVTGVHDLVFEAELRDSLLGPRVDDQFRVRVCLQQHRQLLGVDVVEVLVRDQHRGQLALLLEARRERARIEQNPSVVGLQQHTSMSIVDDLHTFAPLHESASGPIVARISRSRRDLCHPGRTHQ